MQQQGIIYSSNVCFVSSDGVSEPRVYKNLLKTPKLTPQLLGRAQDRMFLLIIAKRTW